MRERHGWVGAAFGMDLDKAGAVLRALCRILRDPWHPSHQILLLNHNKMRKKSHLAPQTEEKVGFPLWFCCLMCNPMVSYMRDTLSPPAQNIQDFNALRAEQSKPISHKESKNPLWGTKPLCPSQGLQNPCAEGEQNEGERQLHRAGTWASSQGADVPEVPA